MRAVLALVLVVASCGYYGYDLSDPEPTDTGTPDGGATCTGDRAECDGQAVTVCETNLATSADNCGACGHSCGGGKCRNRACVAEPISALQAEDHPSGLAWNYDGVCWSTGGGNAQRCWDSMRGLKSYTALTDPPARTLFSLRAAGGFPFYLWVNPEEGALRKASLLAMNGGATPPGIETLAASSVLDVAAENVFLTTDGHVHLKSAAEDPGDWIVPGALAVALGLDGSVWVRTATELARLTNRRDKGTAESFAPATPPVSMSHVGVQTHERVDENSPSRLLVGTAGGNVLEFTVPGKASASRTPVVLATGLPFARGCAAPPYAGNKVPLDHRVYCIAGAAEPQAGFVYELGAAGSTPRKVSETPARELHVTEDTIFFTDHDGTAIWRVAR